MLKVREFSSLAASLMRLAMGIIRDVGGQLDKMIETKGHLDFATEADFRIQGLISAGLSRQWPGLAIIGEEKETKLWEVDVPKLQETSTGLFAGPEFMARNGLGEELPVAELCVWVDPLDGTLDFVKGTLDGVTVLVGAARGGVPELALIGKPFSREGEGYAFTPRVTMARRGHPFFYTWDQSTLLEQPVQVYPFERLRVGVSSHRENEAVDKLISALGAERVSSGGFGRKTLQVLGGEIEAFLYLNGKTSRWDSICMEVVADIIGGAVLDTHLQKYQYGPEQGANPRNERGVLVARSREVLARLEGAGALLRTE